MPEKLSLANSAPFLCVSVIEGEGSANGHAVKKGSNFLVPATVETVELEGPMRLVVSHV